MFSESFIQFLCAPITSFCSIFQNSKCKSQCLSCFEISIITGFKRRFTYESLPIYEPCELKRQYNK